MLQKTLLTLLFVGASAQLVAMDDASLYIPAGAPGSPAGRLRIALSDVAPGAPGRYSYNNGDVVATADSFLNAPHGLERRYAAHKFIATVAAARRLGVDEDDVVNQENLLQVAKDYVFNNNPLMQLSLPL